MAVERFPMAWTSGSNAWAATPRGWALSLEKASIDRGLSAISVLLAAVCNACAGAAPKGLSVALARRCYAVPQKRMAANARDFAPTTRSSISVYSLVT